MEKNKHKEDKGKKDKVTVVGVKDRSTNKITAKPVPETTKARLDNFIEGTVKESAKKYTDENTAYKGLSNHESVKHSVGEIRARTGTCQRHGIILEHGQKRL